MSRTSLVFCAAAAAFVLAGCGGSVPQTAGEGPSASTFKAASPNLIVDGSFEKPTAPSGSYLSFSTGQTFSQWTVTGASGNVAIIGKNFTFYGFKIDPGCGNQALDLTGSSNSKTGVSQQITTVSGTSYLLSFKVGTAYAPGGGLGTSSTVLVYVNGKKLFAATNKRGKGKMKEVWQKFSKAFTAKSDYTTIEFLNGDPSTDTDNGLDCITLEATS